MRGFSLIELMVALGIAGVLSGIALPSYHHTLQRSQRQDARIALIRIQQFQERHFAEHLRYATRLPAPADAEGLGLDSMSDAGGYELSLQPDAGGLGYTALARVRGRQSGDRNCAVLTLDQSGRRGSEDASGHRLLPDTGRCWN
jgi:type IV pilus assembly protein PilE